MLLYTQEVPYQSIMSIKIRVNKKSLTYFKRLTKEEKERKQGRKELVS